MARIIEAEQGQIQIVRELFLEYSDALEFDLGFQNFESEIRNLPGDYRRPSGGLLLAYQDFDIAGCVGFKRLDGSIAEMKRLYVRPEFQGFGLGRALVSEVLRKSKSMGYKKVRLDTVPSMSKAIALYKSMGFYSIPAYRENPIVGASFFEADCSKIIY